MPTASSRRLLRSGSYSRKLRALDEGDEVRRMASTQVIQDLESWKKSGEGWRVLRDRNCDMSGVAASSTSCQDVIISPRHHDQTPPTSSAAFPEEKPNRKRLSLLSSLKPKYRRLSLSYYPPTSTPDDTPQDTGPTLDHENLPKLPLAPKPAGFLCYYCGAKCSGKEELRRHMSLRHTGDGFYTCTICQERLPSYFSMFSLEQHMLAHRAATRSRQLQCDVCGKCVRSERALAQHLAQHSQTKIMVLTIKQEVDENSPAHTTDPDPPHQVTLAEPVTNVDSVSDTVPEATKTCDSRENSLFEFVGLKKRVVPPKVEPGGPGYQALDVISDTRYLRTERLVEGGPWLEEVNNNKGEDGLPPCKPCTVLILDCAQFYSTSYRCSKCGERFLSSHMLSKHVMDASLHPPKT